MKFIPQFNLSAFNKAIDQMRDRVDDAVYNRLMLVGEAFVKRARENGAYKDDTGNLRSSIGYVILYNGKIIQKNFEQVYKGSSQMARKNSKKGTNGVKKGQQLAIEVAEEFIFLKGYVLIGVAGMEYAAKVESKGKDVITGAYMHARNDLVASLNEVLRKLPASADKAIRKGKYLSRLPR